MWAWIIQEIVKSPLIRPLMHFLLKTQLKEVGVAHFYQSHSPKHVLNQLVLTNILAWKRRNI